MNDSVSHELDRLEEIAENIGNDELTEAIAALKHEIQEDDRTRELNRIAYALRDRGVLLHNSIESFTLAKLADVLDGCAIWPPDGGPR